MRACAHCRNGSTFDTAAATPVARSEPQRPRGHRGPYAFIHPGSQTPEHYLDALEADGTQLAQKFGRSVAHRVADFFERASRRIGKSAAQTGLGVF